MCVPLKVEENYNGGGITESLRLLGLARESRLVVPTAEDLITVAVGDGNRRGRVARGEVVPGLVSQIVQHGDDLPAAGWVLERGPLVGVNVVARARADKRFHIADIGLRGAAEAMQPIEVVIGLNVRRLIRWYSLQCSG